MLFALTWSRAWAELPQVVVHDHAHGAEVSETTDHCSDEAGMIEHVGMQKIIVEFTSPASDPAHQDADEDHHHHLELCGVGCSAVVSQWHMTFIADRNLPNDIPAQIAAVRRHERLLRPPQA